MYLLQMRHLYHFNRWLIIASLPTKGDAPACNTETTWGKTETVTKLNINMEIFCLQKEIVHKLN